MSKFSMTEELCNRCGLCAADCPMGIIELDDAKRPFISAEREKDCLQCQHCLAICPTAAISILGLNPADSLPVSADVWPRLDQITHLLRGRRSIRQYQDRNVDPALIDRLLRTVAHAPTGVNSRALTFSVIDDKDALTRFRDRVMQALVEAAKSRGIPPKFAYFERTIAAYVETGRDVIFRGAPHVLIVSAQPHAPCATEDVAIALAYFELLAQSAGLGTVWCGLLKLALECVPTLKSLVDLPPGHHYYTMLFGHPAVHYARTVQRDNAATIRRVQVALEG